MARGLSHGICFRGLYYGAGCRNRRRRGTCSAPHSDHGAAVCLPDGSTLLVADEVGQTAFHGPLWSVPVLGGSARKLGDIDTPAAGFSPDGQMIVYCSGNDLFLSKSDGSESRQLVSLSDAVFDPAWSPDAKSIRFRLGGGFTLWALSGGRG